MHEAGDHHGQTLLAFPLLATRQGAAAGLDRIVRDGHTPASAARTLRPGLRGPAGRRRVAVPRPSDAASRSSASRSSSEAASLETQALPAWIQLEISRRARARARSARSSSSRPPHRPGATTARIHTAIRITDAAVSIGRCRPSADLLRRRRRARGIVGPNGWKSTLLRALAVYPRRRAGRSSESRRRGARSSSISATPVPDRDRERLAARAASRVPPKVRRARHRRRRGSRRLRALRRRTATRRDRARSRARSRGPPPRRAHGRARRESARGGRARP